MKYEIFGGSFPAVTVTLNDGEQVFTQSGALAWADEDVEMSTNMEGGFLKSVGRAFSGASLMFVTHTAKRDNSKVTFAASFPGTIKEFVIDDNHQYYAQKSAFLLADPGVEVDATVNKNFWAGLLGGEGFILQKFSGNGLLLAEIDGSICEIELKEGETLKIDTGHVAVFESTISYSVEAVKGVSNVLFGGEGLFLTTLTGPGKVWLQTLTADEMARRLRPYVPSASSGTSSSNASVKNSSNK